MHFGKRVYLIDFYGNRQSLTRNLKQLLAETGVRGMYASLLKGLEDAETSVWATDLRNEDEVWKYIRQEFSGRIVPCPHSCLQLQPLIAEFAVMCATIQGSGLWMDPPSVMLLAEKSSNGDLANVLAQHRENNADQVRPDLVRCHKVFIGSASDSSRGI